MNNKQWLNGFYGFLSPEGNFYKYSPKTFKKVISELCNKPVRDMDEGMWCERYLYDKGWVHISDVNNLVIFKDELSLTVPQCSFLNSINNEYCLSEDQRKSLNKVLDGIIG